MKFHRPKFQPRTLIDLIAILAVIVPALLIARAIYAFTRRPTAETTSCSGSVPMPHDPVQLYVRLERIDIATSSAVLTVLVYLPQEAVERIRDEAGRPVYSKGEDGFAYRSSALEQELTVRCLTTSVRDLFRFNSTLKVPLPPKVADSYVSTPQTMIVPVRATPTQFPSDWYRTEGAWSIELPETMRTDVRSIQNGLPLNTTLDRAPGLDAFRVDGALSHCGPTQTEISFVAFRPWQWVASTYVVLASLLALLLVAWFPIVRTKTTDSWTVLSGLAAMALAALPIRSVIIPAEISFTGADAVLTFFVTAMVAMMIHVIRRSATRD